MAARFLEENARRNPNGPIPILLFVCKSGHHRSEGLRWLMASAITENGGHVETTATLTEMWWASRGCGVKLCKKCNPVLHSAEDKKILRGCDIGDAH